MKPTKYISINKKNNVISGLLTTLLDVYSWETCWVNLTKQAGLLI